MKSNLAVERGRPKLRVWRYLTFTVKLYFSARFGELQEADCGLIPWTLWSNCGHRRMTAFQN